MTLDGEVERVRAYIWHVGKAVVAEVPDAERARYDSTEAGLTISVLSATQGQVSWVIPRSDVQAGIAAVTPEQIAALREHVREAKADAFELLRGFAEDMLAKRQKPLDTKAANKERRVSLAAKLKAEKKSVRLIAQIMLDEGEIRGSEDPQRSVRRWLAEAEKRTNRETSDSP
jgi:hypothetical protein